jgi:hypothetical protein
MTREHMVGARDEQRPQVGVTSFGDAELRALGRLTDFFVVAVPGSNPHRGFAEPFFTTQSENIGQPDELTYTIYLDQCLCSPVPGFG